MAPRTTGNIVRNNRIYNTGSEYNAVLLGDTDGAEVYGNFIYGTGSYCRPILIRYDGLYWLGPTQWQMANLNWFIVVLLMI